MKHEAFPENLRMNEQPFKGQRANSADDGTLVPHSEADIQAVGAHFNSDALRTTWHPLPPKTVKAIIHDAKLVEQSEPNHYHDGQPTF